MDIREIIALLEARAEYEAAEVIRDGLPRPLPSHMSAFRQALVIPLGSTLVPQNPAQAG